MIVFCPGCGTKISAPASPIDPDAMVTCPKCKSQFATAGVKADPSLSQPKRKFKPKQKSGSGAGIAIGILVIALLGGGAYALYHFGFFSKSSSGSGSAVTNLAPTAWREFSSADGRFRVMLPGAPVRIPRPSKKETEYSLETPDAKIGVVYADLSEKDKPEKLMIPPLGAKVLSERDLTQGNYSGREIIVDVPNHGITHMRFLSTGKRLYTVVIVGKNKPPAEAEIARVFDSFQITG